MTWDFLPKIVESGLAALTQTSNTFARQQLRNVSDICECHDFAHVSFWNMVQRKHMFAATRKFLSGVSQNLQEF